MNKRKPAPRTIIALLWVAAALSNNQAFAQGTLTPPGAPAPTMKSLGQIEPRTPVSSVPFAISASGSYYLTTNLTTSSGNAITINVNDVTLDLNGFTIHSTANPAAGNGITLGSSVTVSNITIVNGHITGNVTNNSAGGFGGTGFVNGIVFAAGTPANVRVKGVSVRGCLNHGINLTFNSTKVEDCAVQTAGAYGIYARVVIGSTGENCGSIGVNADTADHCYGSALGGGTGVSANTANNCNGYCSGSGTGVSATVANSCNGQSATGTGVSANTANNCYGNTSGMGTGVSAAVANNCSGSSTSGTGVSATGIALGCYGASGSGTGVSAFIASSCHGTGATPISAIHNVNSF